MIHKQFNKLIPYVSENFITYPLWEEGKYIPFVNFWFIPEGKIDIYKKLLKFKNKYYELHIEDTESSIKECQLYPKFKECKDLGYKYLKKDWSIEEMIEIIIKLLNL